MKYVSNLLLLDFINVLGFVSDKPKAREALFELLDKVTELQHRINGLEQEVESLSQAHGEFDVQSITDGF